MTAAPHPNPTTVADWLAIAADLLASSPARACPPAYEGSEDRPEDAWSERELERLGDRRAGWHYPEGP